jgi:hypothetical protein
VDNLPPCLAVTLQAIDNARNSEGLKAMVLPADFPTLPFGEQLLLIVDRERVDRGLAPVVGLSGALDAAAAASAPSSAPPAKVGSAFFEVETDWVGDTDNALDVDYQWMYDDGPGSGTANCSHNGDSGCWVDRNILLNEFKRTDTLVMGAALDPTGDNTTGDKGGTAVSVILATTPPAATATTGSTWAALTASSDQALFAPDKRWPANLSATDIPNPPNNVNPDPDYTQICAQSGVDSSAPCVNAVLAAIDHARSLEGVLPMVLPADFGSLSIPDQVFVAIDRERVDRGLTPFVGLTAALNANAQIGANTGDDPPLSNLGDDVLTSDSEWAGGFSNGLDAVYGWMYDDGYNSGNLDCETRNAAGCWGHRTGILDDFGTVGTLEMGAAYNPTGCSTADGCQGDSSAAATLVVTTGAAGPFVYTWAQARADMPAGGNS